MLKSKFVASLVLAAGVAGLSGVAVAAPILTSTDCSESDVTFRGNDSDQCVGVYEGNTGDMDWSTVFSGGWGAEHKIEGPSWSTTFSQNGVDFELSSTDRGTEGTYLLSWAGALPKYFDLMVATKASRYFSAYLFDEEYFASNPNSGNGGYAISWTTPNGRSTPELSHLSLFMRDGSSNPNCPPTNPNCQTPVPAPAPLVMVGMGLLGLLGVKRFLKKS